MFFFLIESRLLFFASPLPGAGMRSSGVEAAGGGAVRANSSTRSFDSGETTEPRSSRAIFVAAGGAGSGMREKFRGIIGYFRLRLLALGR